MEEVQESWGHAPVPAKDLVTPHLEDGESPLAWFEPDLNPRMQFAQALVVLTDRRVIHFDSGKVEEWRISPDTKLAGRDHAGIGRLELSNSAGRLCLWRYTAARATGSRRIVERLEALHRGVAAKVATTVTGDGEECSLCGAHFEHGPSACPECGHSTGIPPVKSLFRLLGFAKNHV